MLALDDIVDVYHLVDPIIKVIDGGKIVKITKVFLPESQYILYLLDDGKEYLDYQVKIDKVKTRDSKLNKILD